MFDSIISNFNSILISIIFALVLFGLILCGKVRTQSMKLVQNEQDYQSLIEQNPDIVVKLNLDGIILSVNRAFEDITGFKVNEWENKHYEKMIDLNYLKITNENFIRATKGIPTTYETVLNHKHRGNINARILNLPIIKKGKIVGVYGIVKDITNQIKDQKMIQYMAYHDYLTGLPNRNMLDHRLAKNLLLAESKNQKTAILFIDLDRFKVVNDTLGHSVGDLLLKEVTKRLKTSVLEKDLVFRQGGDEFIVVLDDVDRGVTREVASRLLNVLSEPYKLNNYDIFTSPSIGISLFPEDGKTVETLIKHADFAMYQAKKAGKNTFRFYSSKEYSGSINPLLMEMELHKAIERDELTLHYQPKVNLKTGKIIGAEALIRWNHPEWGMVSPANFIPIAEDTGLIIPIGEWVLHKSCSQNKQWHENGFSNQIISVNLSARQFSQSNIVQSVEKALSDTGLEAQFLELEITESMTLDIERTISILLELKKLGVCISIDDFGTGFSSLNYLKQFPVDTLKIDQSFVRELHNNTSDETIVKTIISMAHNLQLDVVAEGIETREQLVFLQRHLCDCAQGYFFSKPIPAKDWAIEASSIEELVKEFGISQDVNERMWIEESLRMARQELQDTVRRQQGLTMKYKKINGKFIHTLCDGELLYRFGLIPDQVIGKHLFEILPEEVAKMKSVFYQKAWDGVENLTYEAEINGIYYLAALSPIRRGGEVAEVIVSCIDITSLKETETALRESQELYRLMAENMSDLIAIFDLEGRRIYTSPSHESVLGYPISYFEDKFPISEIHPDDQAMYAVIFEETVRSKKTCMLELRMSVKNGGWKVFESVMTPVIEKNGLVKHIVGVARDITEKRNAEELLWKSEKLSVVGELAAGVAHEIRNPITSIKGFFQLFQQGNIKSEYFEVVLAEFNRIESIINDFLTLAKTQAIQMKKVNINELMNDVIKLLESEANLRNIQFSMIFESDSHPILCDPNQLKQVFINLVKNSIEAMPSGGVIQFNVCSEDGRKIIKIQDNGIGISEDRIESLGEPFFSNKEKGTGMGLMLCHKIIKEHKGTIVYKSKEKQGTVVEVRLPSYSP